MLYVWDFFIGVQDLICQGVLWFWVVGIDEFLGNEKMVVLLVMSFCELEFVVMFLMSKCIDDLDVLCCWFVVFVVLGVLLGGVWFKVNFLEQGGVLWIGKFFLCEDDCDIGVWEVVIYMMVESVGIDVLFVWFVWLNNEFYIFCV